MYTAATALVGGEGEGNPLLEQAMQIGEAPTDETQRSPDIEARAREAVVNPKVGSYEAFMSSFGAPKRWAGR